MAGLKAALFAPTWPTINGAWIPALPGSWWNDPLAIHLAHRTVAYLIAAGVLAWWWSSRQVLSTARHAVLGLVGGLQVLLGVLVSVRAPFHAELLIFGVLHPLVGVLLRPRPAG